MELALLMDIGSIYTKVTADSVMEIKAKAKTVTTYVKM